MFHKGFAPIIVIVIVTLALAALGGAGYYVMKQKAPGPLLPKPPVAPVVTSIAPSSGAMGTAVTITGSGFSKEGNTIRFAGTPTAGGYLNNLISEDGRTLRFEVPEGLDLCVFPPVGTAYCMGYAKLFPGEYALSVITKHDESNAVDFTVVEGLAPTPSPKTGECKITGCSGQICSDQDVITTCEWREDYACYKTAKCERQSDGKCGWTVTGTLQLCLFEKRGTPPAVISPKIPASPKISPTSARSPLPLPSPSVVLSSPPPSPTPSPSLAPSPILSPADTQPPYVKGFKVDGLPDGRTKMTAALSESIDADSVTTAVVHITRADNTALKLDGTIEKSASSFSLLTNVGLSTNVQYILTAKKEVKDLAGNALESDFSCAFTWRGTSISGCPAGLFVTVKISSSGFSPKDVTIQRGATVVFKNEDTASRWPASDYHPTHTLCSGFDPLRGLSQGETYQFTFTEAKDCPYHDHLRPSLTGVVRVEVE